MSALIDRLESDLTAAMKSRDALVTSTIRMTLTAIRNEEVAGKQARTLTEDEAVTVVRREVKKRREAAQTFDDAGRTELADKERAEEGVLNGYLPAELSDEELTALVQQAIAGITQMGPAIKAAQAAVAGRTAGGRVAAEVKRQLTI